MSERYKNFPTNNFFLDGGFFCSHLENNACLYDKAIVITIYKIMGRHEASSFHRWLRCHLVMSWKHNQIIDLPLGRSCSGNNHRFVKWGHGFSVLPDHVVDTWMSKVLQLHHEMNFTHKADTCCHQ